MLEKKKKKEKTAGVLVFWKGMNTGRNTQVREVDRATQKGRGL